MGLFLTVALFQGNTSFLSYMLAWLEKPENESVALSAFLFTSWSVGDQYRCCGDPWLSTESVRGSKLHNEQQNISEKGHQYFWLQHPILIIVRYMYLSEVMLIIVDQTSVCAFKPNDFFCPIQDANEWRRMQDPYDTRTMILLLWDIYVSTL